MKWRVIAVVNAGNWRSSMVTYSRTEEGLTLVADEEAIHRFLPETKAAILRLGLCADCQGSLEADSLRCAKAAHDCIFFAPPDDEEIRPLLDHESNRGRVREKQVKRQERLREMIGFHDNAQVRQIWQAQEGCCYYCGEIPSVRQGTSPYFKDHMTPISKGGTGWLINIALTCYQCNRDKSNLSAHMFWKRLGTIHGQKWVDKRKESCRLIDALKKELYKAFKAKLPAAAQELENHLNADTLNTKYEEMVFSVSIDSNRLIIVWNNGTLELSQPALRRLMREGPKRSREILNAIMGLEAAMGKRSFE